MRSIEEIKADIERFKPCNRISNICTKEDCKRQSSECDEIHAKRTKELKNELLQVITSIIPLDRLEEICQAERDGRLVVLPCKVGGELYCESWIKGHITSFNAPDLEWILENKGEIGKTVFLTKEEAKQALGGAE